MPPRRPLPARRGIGLQCEAGTQLFSVSAIRYYGQRMRGEQGTPRSLHGMMLQTLIGESRRIRRRDWMKAAIKSKARNLGRRIVRPFHKPVEPTGVALLIKLFGESCGRRAGENGAVREALPHRPGPR